jgi:hypothetical protein
MEKLIDRIPPNQLPQVIDDLSHETEIMDIRSVEELDGNWTVYFKFCFNLQQVDNSA